MLGSTMRSPILTAALCLPALIGLAAQTPQKPKMPDAALAPANLDSIKGVLDNDLASALSTGALNPANHGGVTIGIVSHGKRLILSYGTAAPDSVFEIGSITKTFTATVLAQMVEQKLVRFDTPVRELLPAGTVAKPNGREITLLDLSDQHSGLPRMPGNFHPSNHENPYSNYTNADLYAFIGKHGVALADGTPFLYSNLGVGLLGTALADRANETYAQLVQREVIAPLGLHNTGVELTPAMRAHLIQGFHANHQPAHPWDFLALAGCGGIRSNAADMLTYLSAQLHPDDLPSSVADTADGKTLSAAITQTHVPRAETERGRSIALNWFFVPNNGSYWHNGGTGGYTSYATFHPEQDFAVIVLFNTSGGDGFADKLGAHIVQRMMGKPAVSLAP
jgi:D-alanyl-D-alanine-carboxypeptidase/D-alanyl-D-alanine-endopeptidase